MVVIEYVLIALFAFVVMAMLLSFGVTALVLAAEHRRQLPPPPPPWTKRAEELEQQAHRLRLKYARDPFLYDEDLSAAEVLDREAAALRQRECKP